MIDDAVEKIIGTEEGKRRFISLAGTVARLFKAIKPDPMISTYAPTCVMLAYIAKQISSLAPTVDISEVMRAIEQLLDNSIATQGYVIQAQALPVGETGHRIDLSTIDFDALRAKFDQGKKRTEAEKLRALIEGKLMAMVAKNRARMDYLERFQRMIDEYNSGSQNVE